MGPARSNIKYDDDDDDDDGILFSLYDAQAYTSIKHWNGMVATLHNLIDINKINIYKYFVLLNYLHFTLSKYEPKFLI
jgi:hypothetical protein